MNIWSEISKFLNAISKFWNSNSLDIIVKVVVGVIVSVVVGVIVWLSKKFWKKLSDLITHSQKSLNDILNDFDINSRDYGNNVDKALKIKETLAEKFPDYQDYILIQYGSSATSKIQMPSDYDFIVLMLGFPQDEKRAMHNKGTIPEASAENIEQVDIVFRDYLSFLFAASAGMPYENSVIIDGKLLKGEEGYFHWLKNITKNQLFDRDFLMRCFDEKITIEKNEYNKCLNEHKKFNHSKYYAIRSGYYYLTSILQRNRIKKFKKVVMQDEIVELSKVRNLYEDIDDGQIKLKYTELVESLKRNRLPQNFHFSDIADILKYLEFKENLDD
ncbi:Uncharacterised protein [Streptococcus pyogenes]|uniref:hypothetical protein n=1 Tax=Streptococcus pyogenes TaxID=1314 RepID=UPI00109D291A|nr:hypothetical protein [Streptococcus pyogenes]VGV31285.1 Uncharacterised protein [Streptococcus pyogenes]VHA71802.1 Uncharacterised protein [Streptococcus pyogenes]VHC47883.1 Uncharacterised protein [Streptococcus pyogenes]VHD05417.1 Uncharacterised protein [Streptococcus pyogenes]VHD33388.1 Uncharacterised protein [Streptococcus pyogenes]